MIRLFLYCAAPPRTALHRARRRRPLRLLRDAVMNATDLEKTARLVAGDACEFRYPARSEWRAGRVHHNGGAGYWHVIDVAARERLVSGLHIGHVRAVGTDPWLS